MGGSIFQVRKRTVYRLGQIEEKEKCIIKNGSTIYNCDEPAKERGNITQRVCSEIVNLNLNKHISKTRRALLRALESVSDSA